MQAAAPNSPLDHRYTDGRYLADNADWHEADSPWKAEQIIRCLRDRNLAPKTIAEIGCGAGGVIAALSAAQPDAQCAGYDISPQAIGLAAPKETARLRFYNRDLLAEPESRFDLLIAADVFEHVPDYLGFLVKLRSRADQFIFHIPLDLSAMWILREYQILRRRRTVGHIHHFTKATALATLEDTGYRVRHWRFTESGFVGETSLKARVRDFPERMIARAAPVFAANFFGRYSLLALAD